MPPKTRANAKKAAAKKKAAPKKDQSLAQVEEQVLEQAQPAESDLEKMLEQYHQMSGAYREPAEHKAQREELRNRIADILAAEGPRYWLDQDGHKQYAWQTTPETVDLDIELLAELDENGLIPPDVLDEVAPRQISRPGLRDAINTGRLTPEQVKKVATVRPQTPRIYTKTLDDGQE